MMTHDEINLTHDWLYNFTNNKGADYSKLDQAETTWIPLPELSDWSVTNSVQAGADWFRKHFMLEAAESCVRWWLVVERVPEHIMLFINGVSVGKVEGSSARTLQMDITEHVALGNNVLAMKLTSTSEKSGGRFGRIYLKRTPCE